METTPVEFSAPSGLTLTLKLFPYGSDVIANGATGDGGTERTNAKSVYSADVTQALSEWHNAVIVDGSGNVIASGAVYLHDTTDIHRVEEPPVRVYAVLPDAAPGAADGVFIAGTNAETTVTTAINANIIGDITGTLDTVTTCTTTTTNTDMRGTNGANTTVPDAAGTAAALHTTTDGKVDANAVHLTDIKGTGFVKDTDSLPQCLTATDANIKTQVVAALNTDTYAEPGQGAPPATATLVQKIGYLFKNWRNKKLENPTTYELYADDSTTVDQKATVSDDNVEFIKGKMGTGP